MYIAEANIGVEQMPGKSCLKGKATGGAAHAGRYVLPKRKGENGRYLDKQHAAFLGWRWDDPRGSSSPCLSTCKLFGVHRECGFIPAGWFESKYRYKVQTSAWPKTVSRGNPGDNRRSESFRYKLALHTLRWQWVHFWMAGNDLRLQFKHITILCTWPVFHWRFTPAGEKYVRQ